MREANDLEKKWFALMMKADFEGKEIISEQLSTVFISSEEITKSFASI
ncbi:TPA: hypothetical protein U0595_002267, partial [Streptococcus suis]|nr:hypothetical protein [Streptococcus suis]HEM2759740.1 hypothetical protein [Streptococcus suis]